MTSIVESSPTKSDLTRIIGLTTAKGLCILILFEFSSFVVGESIELVEVVFSNSRTLCEDLFPLPHILLRIFFRRASSSIVSFELIVESFGSDSTFVSLIVIWMNDLDLSADEQNEAKKRQRDNENDR